MPIIFLQSLWLSRRFVMTFPIIELSTEAKESLSFTCIALQVALIVKYPLVQSPTVFRHTHTLIQKICLYIFLQWRLYIYQLLSPNSKASPRTFQGHFESTDNVTIECVPIFFTLWSRLNLKNRSGHHSNPILAQWNVSQGIVAL